MVSKINQVDIQRLTLRRMLFNLVCEGIDQKQITDIVARKGISKQSVSKALRKMVDHGWIYQVQKYPKLYKPTDTGRKEINQASLRLSERGKLSRVEHYQIKFPLMNPDQMDFVKWDSIKPDGFNRWWRKYHQPDWPHDVKIERTTKSIIFHVHQRHFNKTRMFLAELATFTAKLILFGSMWLRNKGIQVDATKAEIISQEIETDAEEFDDKVEPNSKITVKLGRQADSVLGPMKTGKGDSVQAKAVLERSYGITEVMSNDTVYEEKLILMPERVDDLLKLQSDNIRIMNDFAKNIELHQQVLRKIGDGIVELRDAVKEIPVKQGSPSPVKEEELIEGSLAKFDQMAEIKSDNLTALELFDLIKDLYQKTGRPVYTSSIYSHARGLWPSAKAQSIRYLLVWLKNSKTIEFDTAMGLVTPIIRRGPGRPRKYKIDERTEKGDVKNLKSWLNR